MNASTRIPISIILQRVRAYYPSTSNIISTPAGSHGWLAFKERRLISWGYRTPHDHPTYYIHIQLYPVGNVVPLEPSLSLCHPCDVAHQLRPSHCKGELLPSPKSINICYHRVFGRSGLCGGQTLSTGERRAFPAPNRKAILTLHRFSVFSLVVT
jgi:hypothetical protein